MATETSKLEIVKEVKCSPHKFYEMIKYTRHHLPTVCPELVPGADIIEGDGESVGTVRLWKYVIPGSAEILKAKEKTEVIDDKNKLIVLAICEGDHTDHYARFVVKIQVIPKGEGSLVNWTLEYDKAKEGVSNPHHYMDLFGKITNKLEAHLIVKS